MQKYQVVITAVPDTAVALIKAIRLAGNLSLKDANNLATYIGENLPAVLVTGIDFEAAEHLFDALTAAQIGARVETSSLRTPMLMWPAATERYEWNEFLGLKRVS